LPVKVAWFDRDEPLIRQFKTGVSLHSHTNRSRESLEFVGRILASHSLMRTFMRSQEGSAISKSGIAIDFVHSYWTPPLCPRSAYEVEKNQIEQTRWSRSPIMIALKLRFCCVSFPTFMRHRFL
jgi:hypothetical protein